MGLLRIFIQQPDGAPLAGMCLTLHQKQGQESSVTSVGRETTDAEGVARFWVQGDSPPSQALTCNKRLCGACAGWGSME